MLYDGSEFVGRIRETQSVGLFGWDCEWDVGDGWVAPFRRTTDHSTGLGDAPSGRSTSGWTATPVPDVSTVSVRLLLFVLVWSYPWDGGWHDPRDSTHNTECEKEEEEKIVALLFVNASAQRIKINFERAAQTHTHTRRIENGIFLVGFTVCFEHNERKGHWWIIVSVEHKHTLLLLLLVVQAQSDRITSNWELR